MENVQNKIINYKSSVLSVTTAISLRYILKFDCRPLLHGDTVSRRQISSHFFSVANAHRRENAAVNSQSVSFL
jgi:hypothetical protein